MEPCVPSRNEIGALHVVTVATLPMDSQYLGNPAVLFATAATQFHGFIRFLLHCSCFTCLDCLLARRVVHVLVTPRRNCPFVQHAHDDQLRAAVWVYSSCRMD